jgi:hypothetical protein
VTDRLCGIVVRVPGYRSRGPGFDSTTRCFWEVVGLERGPLSLVSTTEELLGRKSRGSGLENRDYGRRGSTALTTRHPLSAKLALTSPTSGYRSIGKVRSRTEATEFCLFVCLFVYSLIRVYLRFGNISFSLREQSWCKWEISWL